MEAAFVLAHAFSNIRCSPCRDSCLATAMSMLRHVSRQRQYLCQHCVRRYHKAVREPGWSKPWAAELEDAAARDAAWEEQAGRIRSGAQQSMLSVLEERGFVKDVAG
jgi:tyrosyl-tRNA synthetase